MLRFGKFSPQAFGPLHQAGIGLYFFTWWVIVFDGITGEPTIIGRLYRGYSISPEGSFIGLIWAFVDGVIGGGIFAWLYNMLSNNFSAQREA